MPESICLHIQDRESGPIRVVEIPWISVRIGSAAYCEVRLADRELAEEACRLQRRGRTWQLVPLGPRGSILVQDRPIERPCPLPFDVPFRVGTICFTLRQNRSAEPDWVMYRTRSSAQRERPSPTNTLSSSFPAPEGRTESIEPSRSQRVEVHETRPPSAPLIEPSTERTMSPGPVNPWEARWKAAGARLPKAEPVVSPSRSRGFPLHPLTPATAPGYPVPPSIPPSSRLDADLPIKPLTQPTEPRTTTAKLETLTRLDRQPASSIRTRDQVSRIDWLDRACPEIRIERADDVPEQPQPGTAIEPAVDTGVVQLAETENPAIDAILGEADCHASSQNIEPATQPLFVPVRDEQSLDDLSAGTEYNLPEDSRPLEMVAFDHQGLVIPTSKSPRNEPADGMQAMEVASTPMMEKPRHCPPASSHNPPTSPEEGVEAATWIPDSGHRFVADTSWTGIISSVEIGSSQVTVSTSTEAHAHLEAGQSDPEARAPIPKLRTATLLDPGTSAAGGRRKASEEKAWPGNSRHRPGIEPEIRRPKTGSDLPSAKDILAAVSRRPSPLPAKPSTRMNGDQGKPTERQEPGQWFPSFWLVWPPAALLVIGMGIVGSLFSVRWSGDSFNASVVSQRLLARSGNQGRGKSLPESVAPPESSWWHTTPLHLAEWGVYLGRTRMADDRTEEARDLLESAVRISPINPMARLARAQLVSRSSESTSRALDLGLSRDAASLAWSARSLRLAGKKEAAIRVYRQALRIACRNDLTPNAEPTFNDEPSVRRYFLPGETTTRAVVRELITDAGWTFQEWSQAVPRDTVAALAAARLLREQERPEAQALLKQILEQERDHEILTTGAERAIQTAMIAEAHALLSQWREAEQLYHQAIDQINDLTIKRSWWFNLASVALQINDEAQRKVALEAALEAPTNDDISRRALELQRASEPLGRLRSNGTKAN